MGGACTGLPYERRMDFDEEIQNQDQSGLGHHHGCDRIDPDPVHSQPDPRTGLPGICLAIMLVSSIALLIQSLVLKQEKVVEFDWEKEKPAILLIVGMCVYIGLMLSIGYVLASIIVFPLVLFYVGERKPGPYIVVLISAFVIFLLFKNVFNISLPALGLLGGII